MSLTPYASALLSASGDIDTLGSTNFPELTPDDKRAFFGSRPTARKINGVVVCAARVDNAQVLLHAHNDLPSDKTISDLVHEVLTNAAERARASKPADYSIQLRNAVAAAAAMPPRKRLRVFLDEFRDQGFKWLIAVAEYQNGSIKRITFTDRKRTGVKGELSIALASRLGNTKLEEAVLNEDLVAQKMGGQKLTITTGPNARNGLMLISLDLPANVDVFLDAHVAYLDLLAPFSKGGVLRGKAIVRLTQAAALIALAVFLAAPAPVYVENVGKSRARESIVTSLPIPVFLDQAYVRPGQKLNRGDRAVLLRSPEIERAITEQKLTQSLEKINAQEALGEGNYAKVQLAEKRQEIARLKEEQLRERLALLNVTAPVDGIVTSIQSSGVSGSYLAAGTPILELQPTAAFEIDIDVAPFDGAIIKPGQKGVVYFRGSETYAFELVTGAVQVVDAESSQPRLQARARLLAKDQSKLLVGLSGYAKIDTGTSPRVYGLLRPAIEYVRLSAWKYLGLTF